MTTLLDTWTVSPSDRPDYWSEGIAAHFFPMRLEALGSHPFAARLTGGEVGPVAVRSIRGVAHRVERTSRMIASGDPESLLLYLFRNGACRIEQDERSCVMGPGDIAFQDTSRPSTFEARGGLDVAVFSVPKWFLGPEADAFAHLTATPIARRRQPILSLAVPFLASVGQAAESGTLSEQDRAGLCDMLGAVLHLLRGEDDTVPDSASRGGTLLGQMRRYAMAHLDDPELGPEQIARAHFVSTRYVHKLFAASGNGVSGWIREQRMDRALRELRDPNGRSIAHVAARCGYRDPASFSRAFRQAHGRSPSEVRSG